MFSVLRTRDFRLLFAGQSASSIGDQFHLIALAAAILTGTARIWMVYVLALAFGIVSGFFVPAAESTVPRLLDAAQLESGNSDITEGVRYAWERENIRGLLRR